MSIIAVPTVEVNIIQQDLDKDNYILEGYVGGKLYFSISKHYLWKDDVEIETHIGRVTNVAGVPVYNTVEPHGTRMEAYIDVISYILKEIKTRWGYEYYGFDSSKFKFIQINPE